MTTNTYDEMDIVRREYVMLAEGMKFAAYRVHNPVINRWSGLQFHMTYLPQAEIGGRSIASTGEVVICGTMSERIVEAFGDFLDRCRENEAEITPDAPWADFNENCEFIAYRRPDGKLEFQVSHDDMVLCVMLPEMAKLFVNQARRTISNCKAPE